MIDDGLFLLCLDNLKTEDPSRLIQSLLCGDDGRNRWFDKCFQLIIDNNGQVMNPFQIKAIYMVNLTTLLGDNKFWYALKL